MPAKNPRLSVVLSPSVAATLAAISRETGDSASSLVRGLLEQSAPALERMLHLVIAAKAARGQIGEGVARAMGRTVDDLQDALAVADSRMGRVTRDLVEQVEEIKGRRRQDGRSAAGRPQAASPTPVPVTRGSGGTSRAKQSSRRGGRS